MPPLHHNERALKRREALTASDERIGAASVKCLKQGLFCPKTEHKSDYQTFPKWAFPLAIPNLAPFYRDLGRYELAGAAGSIGASRN